MKEKTQTQKANSLLWKFLALFIVVLLLFNIDYKRFLGNKEEASVGKAEEKKVEATIEEEIDLEDYLLDEIDKEILETIKLEQIKYYRKYIVNTSLLLRKFSDHENYGKEVKFLLIKSEFYPKEISDLLSDLKDFNEKYLHCKVHKYKDLKLGGGFFKKTLDAIFDVKKENPEYKAMLNESKALKAKLIKLENYFYSVEFLKMHLSYD